MRKLTAFLLALALTLGVFAAAEEGEFVPATAEPSAEVSIEVPTEPSAEASAEPSAAPTEEASIGPSTEPSEEVSTEPTEPSGEPTEEPTTEVSGEPTAEPTEQPSAEPSVEPSAEPSYEAVPPTTHQPGGYIVRAGLYYGSTALASANLANEVGSGYLFGSFDADGVFTEVGFTTEEKITMFADRNMYVKSGTYYDSLAPEGSTAIGAYHIQTSHVCVSFFEASERAAKFAAETGLNAFPAYINGEWRVRVGSYRSTDAAEEARIGLGWSASTIVGASSTGYTAAVTSSGRIVFEFDMGGACFGVKPIGADDPVTWFKGYKWSGGFEYKRLTSGSLSVIGVVEIGDYTKGVIPYEIGTNWTEEGTKVGAICASSFVVYNKNRHGSSGFDVCTTDHCQVYKGLNRATENSNAWCDAVADEALFYNGEICNTVYHSTNGGWTEDAKNVWGSDIPYLKAVEDTFEDLDRASYGRWSFTYTGEQISWILNQKGYAIGTVTKAWVEEFTPAGNVYKVSFQDASGTKHSFEKERARSILGSETLGKYTYSQRYTIKSGGVQIAVGEAAEEKPSTTVSVIGANGVVEALVDPDEVYVITASGTETLTSAGEGEFIVSGTGWGHNVGLSQWGSRGRAEAGWDYKSILEYYYTGAKVQKINEVMG